jgi:hypothetical protein
MRDTGRMPAIQAGRRQRQSPFFATCPAGLARILRDQLAGLPGIEITGSGSDGQRDYILFAADRDGRALALASRLADGVFADAGRFSRAGTTDPNVLATRSWRADSVQRALSVWAEQVRPLSASMSYSVTTSVHTGPRELHSGIRRALTQVVGQDRPRWKPAARAELEIWLAEWRDGELVTGLRLGGNRRERAGGSAFSPAFAAGMVYLAGPADGLLLDPCCGTGAVLAEAAAAGWAAAGTDSSADLLDQARAAAPGADVSLGDAREILEPDDSVAACVSRLPPAASDGGWLGSALAEMSRVTRSDGAVILLAPEIPRTVLPGALRLRRQIPVRLADGQQVWVFRRR